MALIFVSLAAVVFVYLLLVAAGRAKLRPDSLTAFLDIFTFGFLRFHFFWATLLWPWVGATILLWLAKRPQGRHLTLGAAFLLSALVVPLTIWLGALDHAASYKARMANRLENEVKCLETGLQKDNAISCPVMIGPGRNMAPIYDFARRHDASFTRYFFDLRTATDSAVLRSLEEGPILVDQLPVGDIVAGMSIVQTVPLNADERHLLTSGGQVCLRLLLATYARPNMGSATVTLSVAHASLQFSLPFASVENNEYYSFCGALNGQPIPPATIPRDLVIRIDGIEGAPGSSVTAWLTKDVSRGTAAVNGVDTGMSLLFTLAQLDEYRMGGIYSIVFYAFAIALLALGFVGVLRSRRKRE